MSYYQEPDGLRPCRQFAVMSCVLLVLWLIHGRLSADTASDLRIQESRWARAEVRKDWVPAIRKALWNYERDIARYRKVEEMKPGGMPALVVFCLHGRESTWDFRCHLHEGSSLSRPTRYVPKGRPPGKGPFKWEESAFDALYVIKHEEAVNWGDIPRALYAIEMYNGTGYLRYHPETASPYLWSGTSVYSRGKYVADGKWDRMAVDRQIGCAAILKMAGDSAWLRD